MTVVLDNDEEIQNPIKYCISVILKEAKEETRLVKQLIYVILSAKTNNPLNLAINSPSGEGKNWVLEKVAEKFPSEDVIFLSGMTDKALFHRRGILVVNKNDFDKNEPSKYVPLNLLVEDIDNQIEDKKRESANTKNSDLIKGLQAAIEDLTKQKEVLYSHTKKLIDLSHKTLVFLDTPRVNLLITIMSLLSHDRYEAEYEFVDTHNGIRTYTNILRGWPAVIFAQAIDYTKHERWSELQRRFIITNPEMNSKKKYAEAVDLALDKLTLPDLAYQKVVSNDAEKNRVKEILKQIGDEILLISERIDPGKNSTYVPFSEVIKDALPKDKSSDMNIAKRFSGFLSLLPMINIGRRPMIRVHIFKEDGPAMQTIPLALFDDLKESIYLMEYANGVRPYVLEWYYDVFLPIYNMHEGPAYKIKKVRKDEEVTIYESRIAVTTQELITATKDKKNKFYTSDHLLHTFVNPLMNQGYIDCIESDLDHRAKIYYPVIASKNTELLKNDTFNILSQPGNVNVKDSTLFPDKSYLISKIEGILKYYSDEGIRWTLCDHEDKEISSVEGLVIRYYYNPDEYFSISEEDQNSYVSQENSSNNNKTTNNEEKESNKLLKDTEFSNSVFSEPESDVQQQSDPSLQQTTEYLRNFQEAEQTRIQKNKSKLADIAKTNLSGNEILPGNEKQQKAQKNDGVNLG